MRLRKLAAPGLILTALAIAGPACAEEYTKSYTIAHRADVRVIADESSVHVTTSDSKQVEIHVHYEGWSTVQIGNELHIDSQQNGDRVELTVKISRGVMLGFSNRHISTEIQMPRDADLSIDTHDGAVELGSLNGNIFVHSNDGSIKGSQLTGHIDLQTNDGGITTETLKGECRLHTSDGSISAVGVDGRLDAASSDGSIRAEGRFDALDIKSGDGSVRVRVADGSKMSSSWNIRTKDGSIGVALPRDFQANLDASSRDGHIELGLPVTVQGNISKSHVTGALNGGGPDLSVRTGDGSIKLTGI